MEKFNRSSRRSFLKTVGVGAAGLSAAGAFAGEGKDEDEIPKRKLGATGLEVTEIMFGGGGLSPNNANVLRIALSKGINFLDTSWSYGRGESEKTMGEVVEQFGRDKVIIQTRASGALKGGAAENMSDEQVEKAIRQKLEESLTRLRTDYIDVYMCPHGVSQVEDVDYPQLRATVEKLKEEGKICFFGTSTHTNYAACAMKAVESGWHDVIMPSISLSNLDEELMALAAGEMKARNEAKMAKIEDEKQRVRQMRRSREIEDLRAVLAKARENNVGVICMKGANFVTMCGRKVTEATRSRFGAEESGMSLHQICYRYMLDLPEIAAVNIGLENMSQLEEALALPKLSLKG